MKTALPIHKTRTLPRKQKRRVWRGWWKHRRPVFWSDRYGGINRAAQRRAWRESWGLVRTEGGKR